MSSDIDPCLRVDDHYKEKGCTMSQESRSAVTSLQKPIPKRIAEELPVITADGFFGLDELHKYFTQDVKKAVSQERYRDGVVALDFSAVETWDIAALLWLVVALDYYSKDQSLNFALRLPEEGTESADFLRRWDFFSALKNLRDDPESLLVDEQVGYFAQRPRTFYGSTREEPDELLRYLLSQDLVRIRNLADVRRPRQFRSISSWLTAECRNVFIESGMGFFLHERCKLPRPKASLFAKEIANEGVLNVQQHPNASVGMASICVSKENDTLVLAIADNGDPIPETIYPHYRWYQRHLGQPGAKELPLTYPRRSFDLDQRRDIIKHATQAGTSRKNMTLRAATDYGEWTKEMDDIGMGLYYVRRDTTDVFHGELLIVADGVSVTFNTHPDGNDPDVWTHCNGYDFPWPGNLLRISIPLTPKF